MGSDNRYSIVGNDNVWRGGNNISFSGCFKIIWIM